MNICRTSAFLFSALALGALASGCTSDSLGSDQLEDTEWIASNSFEVNARIKSSLTHEASGSYSDLASNAEKQAELITTHISYAKNPLEDAKYYMNVMPDEIISIEVDVDGDDVTLSYEASIDMVRPNLSGGIPDSVEALPKSRIDMKLPLDPVGVYTRGRKDCASGYGSYTLSEAKYFYYFDYDKSSCDMLLSGATLDVVSIYPQPKVYPEYDRLLNDLADGAKGFRAAILPNLGDNDVMSRFNAHKRELTRSLGLEPTDEGKFHRYAWNKEGATIIVDLFDPTEGYFAGTFHAALGTYQLVFYNGHSNYGHQPFLDREDVYSDDYQIIGMHSCKSYSYYANQVAAGKATDSDPAGWVNADMVATGRSSYPNDSPYVAAELLQGLMSGLVAITADEPSLAPSWQDIGERMKSVAPSILYGIAGARENAWKPPSADEPGEPTNNCAHDLCDTGVALNASCDPCAATVINGDDGDAYCRDNSWDIYCVQDAVAKCGLSCN